ncbi:GntR family transcriptional regulator [Streptomyces niveus]|uniref:GntR family transcriptional regulator n=1 Tax=Streptomyces niveus TaxID=193462 RepID=UPI00369B701C
MPSPALHVSAAPEIPDLLRRDLTALPSGRRSAATFVQQQHATTCQIAERWLWLVDERRRAAGGSPSDQARWTDFRAAVEQAPAAGRDHVSLLLLLGTVRDMLKDLRATHPPCPTVAEIAERIRSMIKADPASYPPGARLSKGVLEREMGIPRSSLDAALADLRADRVLDPAGSGPARVRSAGPNGARRLDVGGWLRTLIRTGVYPPGQPLPLRSELVRTLAIGEMAVADTIRTLAEEGVLRCPPGSPADVLPDATSRPFDLASAAVPSERPLPSVSSLLARSAAAASRTRASWKPRACPPVPDLDADFDVLRTAALHLAPLVDLRRPGAAADVARAVVTATEPLPVDDHQQRWRTACLAIAVQDLHRHLTVPTP